MSNLKRAVKQFSENMKATGKVALGIPFGLYGLFTEKDTGNLGADAIGGAITLLAFCALPVLLPIAVVVFTIAACAALAQAIFFPFQALFAIGRDLFASGSAKSSGHGCGQEQTCCEPDVHESDVHEPDVAPGHFSHPFVFVRKNRSKKPQCHDENDASPSMSC